MRSLAMSIFVYACETWTITADIERRIQALEMRCFRKLLGISYSSAVQGLRFSCYSWAPGHHSWTREPRHTVHVTDVYATESRTPPVLELSADRFSVGLLLHCSPPTQGQSRGVGKGVWRPCTAVLSCERGKTTHLLSIQITTNSSSL